MTIGLQTMSSASLLPVPKCGARRPRRVPGRPRRFDVRDEILLHEPKGPVWTPEADRRQPAVRGGLVDPLPRHAQGLRDVGGRQQAVLRQGRWLWHDLMPMSIMFPMCCCLPPGILLEPILRTRL